MKKPFNPKTHALSIPFGELNCQSNYKDTFKSATESINCFLSKLLILFLLAISSSSAFCQILNVPGKYPSIQKAIQAAQKGDTVLVDEGTYYENINFRGKSIVVASKYLTTKDTSYITKTIIDGSKPLYPDSASCVMLINAEDNSAVLAGFTITHGKGTIVEGYIEGGGVLLYKSNATIRNNIITHNSVSAGGGGIAAWRGKPSLLNNLVINNTGEYAAGIVLNWSDGIIKNNIIYHNIKTGSRWLTGGLMIWDALGHPLIENNTIVGNYSNTQAGGISITPSSTPVLRNNIVWGNRQSAGPQLSGAKANSVTYCDLETPIAGEGNISTFPAFKPDGLSLIDGSPCIDAGCNLPDFNDQKENINENVAKFPSLGTTFNDMGAFGGPGATLINSFNVSDIYLSKKILSFGKVDVGKTKTLSMEIFNPGTLPFNLDSLIVPGQTLKVSYKKGLQQFKSLEGDTLIITWQPSVAGDFSDTIKIYHSLKNIENPQKVVVQGKGNQNTTGNLDIKDQGGMFRISPNPCTSKCKIDYQINTNSQVNLSLYDLNGKKIKELINSKMTTGEHQLLFDRSDLKNGIYFFQLLSEDLTINKKIVFN